jgi:chaperonin GroEL
MTKIIYSKNARESLLSGVIKIAKAVKVTLGPSGRNVFIRDSQDTKPYSTKDGVTVAGKVFSDDPVEMSAMESIKDVANSSDGLAGDGTTTSVVLAESIFGIGCKIAEDSNLLDVKKGIDICSRLVTDQISKLSVPCETEEMIKNVALVSSNNDEEIASVVSDAFHKAGKQGVINIKRSRDASTYLTQIKGMNLPMGFRSPYFKNIIEDDTCRFKDAYVFITNESIDNFTIGLENLFNFIADKNASILLICKDITLDVLDLLITNKVENQFQVCVCKAPLFGEEQTELLKDLSTFLGGVAFFDNEGLDFEDIDPLQYDSYIPRVSEVEVGSNMTSFKGPAAEGDALVEIKKSIDARVNLLRESLDTHKTEYEKSSVQTRISRLTDGLVFINIGAQSDTEFTEKQHRMQDSLYAVKAAYSEGILPGGGVALVYIGNLLKSTETENESVNIGIQIVIKALESPFLQIMHNVGFGIDGDLMSSIRNNFGYGFDARNKSFEKDMVKAGIIDPAKVTRVALENAASIAGMMLTTECVIVDPKVFETANYKNQLDG